MNLKPLYEKIVVELNDKQEIRSETGLSYTKNMSISANSTMVGTVVAIGEGRLLSDGAIVPLKVKVGDKVVFSKMQGDNYNDGNKDYTILSESMILLILEGDND